MADIRRMTSVGARGTNPVLPAGVYGWERDTGVVKLGDGVTQWNNLGLAGIAPGAIPASVVLKIEAVTASEYATLPWVDPEIMYVIDDGRVLLGSKSLASSGLDQPADSDLTAIAALVTTSYGRSLLTTADVDALATALAPRAAYTSRYLSDTASAASAATVKAAVKVTGDSFDRLQITADGTIKTGDGTTSPAVPVDPSQWAIDNAVETMFRGEVTPSAALLLTSGRMNFTHFRANRNLLAANWNIFTASTAAGATPTLCRAGLYTVAANGDLTLVASIANSTTLFAAANTKYTRALSSSYQIVRGATYAVGLLVVTGATMPTFCGTSFGTGLIYDESPVMTTRLDGQTDLPASLARSTVVSNAVYNPWRIWSWFT